MSTAMNTAIKLQLKLATKPIYKIKQNGCSIIIEERGQKVLINTINSLPYKPC